MKNKLSRTQMIFYWIVVLLVMGFQAFAQQAFAIPAEVEGALGVVQNAFTGSIAKVIIGICFAGSCIAYAYNKDNEKMKAKLIAVMIASGLLALSQTLITQAMSLKSS